MAAKTYVSDYDGTMVRTTAGRFDTVNKGGAVPANADPEHVDLLVERKMIHEGEPVVGVVFDADVPPPFAQPEGSARKAASKEQ